MAWEIQRQQVRLHGAKAERNRDKADLVDFLGDGWEPFAVTWDGHSFDYHLKRQYDGSGVRTPTRELTGDEVPDA